MSNKQDILGPMRLPFLTLPPVCVFLGTATAYHATGHIHWLYAVLALIGGLAAHISVNAFNEYVDFKTGLDARTQRTPFSGGSGTLPANPAAAGTALRTGWVTLIVTALIGVFFLFARGWGLLPLGLLGLLLVAAYTPWVTRWPFLCLLAPGLGFGPMMVMGTHFVLTGSYSWTAFLASLVPFFLVSDLLLLNQFPDVDADRSAGRRHYPIVLGRHRSSWIYGLFLLLAYVTVALGVFGNVLPRAALLGLLSIVLAVPLFLAVTRNAENLPRLVPFMGLNVILVLATPILVGVGLLLS